MFLCVTKNVSYYYCYSRQHTRNVVYVQRIYSTVLEVDVNIRNAKIVHDLRVFEAANVSRDHGRERLRDLVAEQKISPMRTPTGRCFMTFNEAEILANAL